MGIQESRGPLRRHLPENRRCAAARHRRRRLCTPSQLNSSLGEHHTDLFPLSAPMVWHELGPNARAGEASPRRAATTLDLPALGLSEPQQPHRKFTRATSFLPGQAAPRFELWNASFAFSGAAPPREHAAGAFRRRSRPFSLGPLDQRPTPTIRTGLDQIWTPRSRSRGRDSRVTVRLGIFVKEPL